MVAFCIKTSSLFGSKLVAQGVQGAEYITPLVFMIVLGTVLLNATTARLFAKMVGVFLKKSNGIMIVGASKSSRIIASYLKDHGRSVVLVDTNASNIRVAKEQGLDAITEEHVSSTPLRVPTVSRFNGSTGFKQNIEPIYLLTGHVTPCHTNNI